MILVNTLLPGVFLASCLDDWPSADALKQERVSLPQIRPTTVFLLYIRSLSEKRYPVVLPTCIYYLLYSADCDMRHNSVKYPNAKPLVFLD